MQRTFALRTFNQHETEVNRHYWSFKVINDYSSYLARKVPKADETLTATLFHASGPDALRIPRTVTDWLGANAEFENWLRLSIAVSASSYLETFIRQVVRSALMSDPICRLGLTHRIDGLDLLKKSQEIPYDRELEAITKGDWNQRISGFKQVFGSSPNILTANKSKLEQIRLLRNDYAHGFGRGLDVPIPTNNSPGTSATLSARSLLDYLGVISRVAAGIDRFLLQNFIGNFELLLFYHQFKDRPVQGREKSYEPHRRLQRAFNKDEVITVDAKFCKDLISYYDDV